MGADADVVAARFARGVRCFVVWVDSAVGGYGWLSVRPEWIGETQLEIAPRPGEGYIWNCVTMAEHRRKGIFRSLLVGISAVARNEGLKRVWVGTVAIPAEKAIAPSGFQPALRFNSLDLPGVQVLSVRPAGDAALAADACSVLAIRTGLRVRRQRRRRH